MNLLSEIKKDAKQFMREKRTVALLVIAPLLVLFLLSAIFSNTTTQISKTNLGMCDLDKSNMSRLFMEKISNTANIVDFGSAADCKATANENVKDGKLTAAIIIPKGFQQGIEQGNTQDVVVIIDNSKVQLAPSIEAYMKAAVQDTGQKIGVVFITTVWNKLENASDQLDKLSSKIAETRLRAAMMKEKVQQTSEALQSINTSRVQEQIDAADGTITSAMLYLDTVDNRLIKVQGDLASYDDQLNQTEADLQTVKKGVNNVTSYIAQSKQGINCSNIVFMAYCGQLDYINASVHNAIQPLDDRIVKVQNARQQLVVTNNTVTEFLGMISLAKNSSVDARARLDNLKNFTGDLQTNKDNALHMINEVNTSLDEIINKTYQLEDIIMQSRQQMAAITGRSPESVVTPIQLTPDYVFQKRTFFDFLLPSLIPLIIMFIALFIASTSLVREKNNGTLSRIIVAQTNPFEYALLSVVSYTVVLLPVAILLTLVASLFYGAFPILDIGSWFYILSALALLILVFVATGVLIAIYAESEATAFLASLVIGLPLLFMSGLLFPFEFMPAIVSGVGQASPLTQSVFTLQSVILYHAPQAGSFVALFVYALIAILLSGISIKKKI